MSLELTAIITASVLLGAAILLQGARTRSDLRDYLDLKMGQLETRMSRLEAREDRVDDLIKRISRIEGQLDTKRQHTTPIQY